MARKLMVIVLVLIAAIAVMFVFTYNKVLVADMKLHQEWETGYDAYLNESAVIESFLATVPDSVASASEDILDLNEDHDAVLGLKPGSNQKNFEGSLRFLRGVVRVIEDIESLLADSENHVLLPYVNAHRSNLERALENRESGLDKIALAVEIQISERDKVLGTFPSSLVGTFMGSMTVSKYNKANP